MNTQIRIAEAHPRQTRIIIDISIWHTALHNTPVHIPWVNVGWLERICATILYLSDRMKLYVSDLLSLV